MLTRLVGWLNRIHFPQGAQVGPGFAGEHWRSDASEYEGWEQLRDRLKALGRKATKRQLAYMLASQSLEDVILAAGGVERAIMSLRKSVSELTAEATKHNLLATNNVPSGFAHEAAVELWYAFFDILFWTRTFEERLDRGSVDKRNFPRNQGLVPSINQKRLRKRCDELLKELRDGPVGKARPLANLAKQRRPPGSAGEAVAV